jgi:RNA polymerase sigma factor (sigma-70 family)
MEPCERAYYLPEESVREHCASVAHSARQEMVEANMRLARYAVRRFLDRYHIPSAVCLDAEDLTSEAFLALCHAAETWDSTRGTFATYAGAAIHHRLLKVCCLERGSAVAQVEFISLDTPIGEEGGERLQDVLPDPRPLGHESADPNWLALEQAIAELPERDQQVVLALLSGSNAASIARLYGCSRQRIKHIQNRAFHRLRKQLAGYDPASQRRPGPAPHLLAAGAGRTFVSKVTMS